MQTAKSPATPESSTRIRRRSQEIDRLRHCREMCALPVDMLQPAAGDPARVAQERETKLHCSSLAVSDAVPVRANFGEPSARFEQRREIATSLARNRAAPARDPLRRLPDRNTIANPSGAFPEMVAG